MEQDGTSTELSFYLISMETEILFYKVCKFRTFDYVWYYQIYHICLISVLYMGLSNESRFRESYLYIYFFLIK